MTHHTEIYETVGNKNPFSVVLTVHKEHVRSASHASNSVHGLAAVVSSVVAVKWLEGDRLVVHSCVMSIQFHTILHPVNIVSRSCHIAL